MLNLPTDAQGSLPNCGLTAMAVAGNVSLADATNAYQKACEDIKGKAMQGNWKGRTFGKVRYKAMTDYLGMELESIDTGTCNLRNLVPTLEKGVKYIVTTTGHVQVVEDGMVIDQRGLVHISEYWGAGKQVKSVLKVIEKVEPVSVLTHEERKKRIEEQKQFDIVSETMEAMKDAITVDSNYAEREYTLKMLYKEMQRYFGDA